jgi:hypothetical protein
VTGWSDRGLRRLAWAGWWLVAVSATVTAVIISVGRRSTGSWAGTLLGEAASLAVVLAFSLVGLVILVRDPRNRMGWLLQVVGLSWAVPGLLDGYAHYGLLVDPGSLPSADIAAALNEGTWTLGIGVMGIYVFLLFPAGRLPSPRWRVVAWAGAAAIAVGTVVIDLSPGQLEEGPIPSMHNPLAVEGAEGLLQALLVVFLPLLPLSMAASALALVLRFRHSHGIERQQIKWLATAGALVAGLYAVTLLATLLGEISSPTGGETSWTGAATSWVAALQEASLLSFLLLPVAIGVAILRYQLFDIDLVINRALVYGSLTATLAALYLGSVLVLQLALQPLTVNSDLAVAASTLAVAAVFGPARRWIQGVVDRRFYRRRYDAALALDAFAGRLRHEVDLDAVGADLLAAVRETVQPTHTTIWLPRTRRTT